MFKYALRLCNVHVLYCIPGSPTCVRFELVKSPEVRYCAVDGAISINKPSVNNNNNSSPSSSSSSSL